MLKAFKRLPLVLPIVFLAVSISTAGSQSLTTDLSNGATFTFEIGKGLPSFTFKVIPNRQKAGKYGNVRSTISGIEVYRGHSETALQYLNGCDLDEMDSPEADSNWFRTADYNFDGYQDIYLETHWGSAGQTGCIWLYNRASGRFDYSKELSGLFIRSLDPSTKTIFCLAAAGAGQYVADKYEVQNNRPVHVWSQGVRYDIGTNKITCVERQRHGGEMVPILDVSVPGGSLEELPRNCDETTLLSKFPQSPQ